MRRRDIIKRLRSHGYRLVRNNGSHSIYQKQGSCPVQVPRHNEINEYTAKAILRAAGLL